MNYEIEYEYEGKKYKIKVDETFVDLPMQSRTLGSSHPSCPVSLRRGQKKRVQ